jgi:pilus assembly protein FimV
VLAAVSLAVSPAAWALGLGEAKVESFLNQPLKARIDLVSQASDDLSAVTAGLASAADYELIGANRESVSVPIRFTVEDIDGDAYIAATSSLPIGDPVLRLIVEVNWSSGRMLREYTLFLDPPTTPESAPPPRIDQRKTPAAVTPAPAAVVPERPATPAPAPAQAPVAAVGGAEYGPVRSGETLWGIARNWSQGSGLTINQAMIAIQRENPSAFMNDNINLLKRGAILRMPSQADVAQISATAASREVASQAAQFEGRKAVANAASTETPLLSDARADLSEPQTPEVADDTSAMAGEQAAAAEQAAEADESSAGTDLAEETSPNPVEARDQLELIPPSAEEEFDGVAGFEETENAAGADGSVEALRENLARTEEELITQQQQNTYLEERIKELESQLESSRESGAADADLANMEDRLREQRQVARADAEPERPWYGRLTIWLIGLLVISAAFFGWLLSRRGHAAGDGGAAVAEESLRGIKDEAEDVLRVLADDTAPAPADRAGATPAKASGGAAVPKEAAEVKPPAADDDAELLDEESSDPEIQLDLARAYISMGDKEAARVILEEVVSNGTEEQQSEARKMLGTI